MTKICLHLALSRPPFLFGSMKKLAIHVPYSAEQHNFTALKIGAIHWSCLFCSALAVYQVQRVLCTMICCCSCTTYLLLCDECVPMADPPPAQLCIVQLFKVLICVLLLIVQHAMHTVQEGTLCSV